MYIQFKISVEFTLTGFGLRKRCVEEEEFTRDKVIYGDIKLNIKYI